MKKYFRMSAEFFTKHAEILPSMLSVKSNNDGEYEYQTYYFEEG